MSDFYARLADALQVSPDEIVQRMSSSELAQWSAYHSVTPFQKKSSSIWSACMRILRSFKR